MQAITELEGVRWTETEIVTKAITFSILEETLEFNGTKMAFY